MYLQFVFVILEYLEGGDFMSSGRRIREARKYRGISQDKLAEILGVSRGVITNIEYEKTEPSLLVLNAICEALDIKKEWVLTGDGEMDATMHLDKRLAEAIHALNGPHNEALKNIARNLIQLDAETLDHINKLIDKML